jgi:hypothetical protein
VLLLELILFILCDYICVQARVSKQGLSYDQHGTVVECLFNLLLTNVVLAIPCALFSTHLQLHIYPGYSLTKELKIISSINCLGYIEFDFVCHLNSLENELF